MSVLYNGPMKTSKSMLQSALMQVKLRTTWSIYSVYRIGRFPSMLRNDFGNDFLYCVKTNKFLFTPQLTWDLRICYNITGQQRVLMDTKIDQLIPHLNLWWRMVFLKGSFKKKGKETAGYCAARPANFRTSKPFRWCSHCPEHQWWRTYHPRFVWNLSIATRLKDKVEFHHRDGKLLPYLNSVR
jgi:hypothetical protein